MADRMWSVFWALCRWWFFGAVLGVVIGGGVGSALLPIGGALLGAWYGGIVGAVVGLIESALVAPAVLLPSSPVVDRIWPGLVGFGMTFALAFAMLGLGAAGERVGVLLVIAGLSGALAAWFGEAVTRGVRIPLPHLVVGAVSLGMVCGVASGVVGLSDAGASEPGTVAGVMLMGLVCGCILGSVLIVFNVLVTQEPAAE